MKARHLLLAALLQLILLQTVYAQEEAAPQDDFNTYHAEYTHGELKDIEYFSSILNSNQKAKIYTPPGYKPSKKYPLLYLLHGIRGSENNWIEWSSADRILDNLYHDKKIPAMIVVFPYCDRDKFDSVMVTDLVPYMEKTYKLLPGVKNRAIGGFSWGGGQTLHIGLTHLDLFSHIGAFSSAPNTNFKKFSTLIPNGDSTNARLHAFWISCGTADNLFKISQNFHDSLDVHRVNHIWHPEPGGHEGIVWGKDLYHFSQLIFRHLVD